MAEMRLAIDERDPVFPIEAICPAVIYELGQIVGRLVGGEEIGGEIGGAIDFGEPLASVRTEWANQDGIGAAGKDIVDLGAIERDAADLDRWRATDGGDVSQ